MYPTNLSITLDTLCQLLQEGKGKHVFQSVNQEGQPGFSALVRVGEDTFKVHTNINLLEKVPGFDWTPNRSHQKWTVRDGQARLCTESKQDMVEALMTLGVSKEDLKRIKTVKTSELRELVSDGGTNNDEIETIMLRLQRKNDTIKMAVEDGLKSKGAYKGVQIEVKESYGQQLNYLLVVDCREFLKSEGERFRLQIEATGAKILAGYFGN